MRILQILPELNVGGVETGTVDFSKYLVDNKHHAVVVSHGGTLVDDLIKSGTKHYQLPVQKKSLFTVIRNIKLLRAIILEEKIDIVHARSRVPAWIAYFACKKTNAEFITTCHGHYSSRFFSRIMGWGKLVITPSDVITRHMIENFDVQAENIRCIPRGVDFKRFEGIEKVETAGQSSFVISMVGRITPLKGHDYFLKAMAKVIRSKPFIKVWIIGDVPSNKESYKRELQSLVRRLGLTDYVEFLGNRRDVPELLAQTDILVMSSVEPESFGRVILEAQAVGVPVVATRVGGVIEIIDDNKTGLLVNPKDIDEMAHAVIRLLNDKPLVQNIVKEARIKLNEKFTLERMASQTLEVYQELLKLKKFLVIKLSSVGDVILVTSSLKRIKKKFPKAKLHCLVGSESREILTRCPYVDELIVVDFKHNDKDIFRFLKIAEKLRKQRFDKVIDFQNNLRSHLLSFLCFPEESYGFNNGKLGVLLTHPVKHTNLPMPPVDHQGLILEKMGITDLKDNYLELWPSEKDKRNVQEKLDAAWVGDKAVLIGINLSASLSWPTKNWPLKHMALLCDLMAAKNILTVVTGMDKDRETVHELQSLSKTKLINLVGKTSVMELAALMKRCKVFISPDSAPMHIAAAMGTPFVALFGPTDPKRHLPPARQFVVFKKEMSCSPCYSHTCRISTHACMRDITPEEVAREVFKLMEQTP